MSTKKYQGIKGFEKMQKIKSNLLSIILVLLVLVILVPMVYLFAFAVMNADDFIYGDSGREIWLGTKSIFSVIKNGAEFTSIYYKTWQGSYFSVFMMSIQPGIISTSLYRFVLLIMFLLVIILPIVALLTFNKFYLKSKIKYILPYGLIYVFMVTQYLPSAFEAFYWYNSAVYYQFTFSMIMLYLILGMHMNNTKKPVLKGVLIVVMALLLITIGGSNYITGITFIMLYTLYLVFLWFKKKKNKYIHTILFALALILFLISVLAPGNGARASNYIQPALHYIAYRSVLEFFEDAAFILRAGISLGVLIILSLWSKKLAENAKIKFVNPLITLVVVVAVLIAQYVPTYYGLATSGPARCANIRYMSLQISLIILVINLYGWLYQNKKLSIPNVIIVGFVAVGLLSNALEVYPIESMWSYKAADYYISGSLNVFSKRIEERIERFEDSSNDVPLSFDGEIENEILHHSDDLWFHYGVWDFYDKIPLRD